MIDLIGGLAAKGRVRAMFVVRWKTRDGRGYDNILYRHELR